MFFDHLTRFSCNMPAIDVTQIKAKNQVPHPDMAAGVWKYGACDCVFALVSDLFRKLNHAEYSCFLLLSRYDVLY